MAIPIPGCSDGPTDLLRKILIGLPEIVISGGSGDCQSGSQAIGNGLDTVSVVFPTPFAVAPVVVVSISRPAADPLIEVNIDEASITVLGFTASLGATTPNADYRLKWMAC